MPKWACSISAVTVVQVSVSDKKPVGFIGVAGRILPQGNLQQFLPELALDGYGGMLPVLVVGVNQQGGSLFEQVAVNAEIPGEGFAAGLDVRGIGVDDGADVWWRFVSGDLVEQALLLQQRQ